MNRYADYAEYSDFADKSGMVFSERMFFIRGIRAISEIRVQRVRQDRCIREIAAAGIGYNGMHADRVGYSDAVHQCR
jgi:hypothetical protein